MFWKRAINIGTAILAAAIVPVIVFGMLAGPHPETITVSLFLAFPVALLHAAVLGLPIYLLLSRKRKLTCVISTIAGFIIGSIPAAIWFSPYENNDSVLVLYAGLFGILGGYTFWLTLHFLSRLNSSEKWYLSFLSSRDIIGSLVAVTAFITILTLPTLTRDRSCHNPARGGETSISPVLSIDVKMTHDEWPQMTDFFIQFSEEHDLELKNSNLFEPGVQKVLYLSMCHDSGFKFGVFDRKWESQFLKNRDPIDDVVIIFIYEFGEETDLKAIVQDFVTGVEERWPNKVSIRSGQDYIE